MSTVLAFLCLIAAAIAAPTCSWVYTDPTTQAAYPYDLSRMTKSSGYYFGTDGSYDYECNVCGIVQTVAQCTNTGALACQFERNTTGPPQKYVATIASWTKTPDPTWAILDAKDPNGGVQQSYNNGEPICVIFGQQKPRVGVIQYKCGSGTSDTMTVSEEPNTCVFTLVLESKYACVGGGDDDGGSSGLSGGWIFIIILVVVIPVYIVAGCIYKTTKAGTSGIESCPNIDFWRDLPGLIKDGFRWVFSGFKKGGDSSYDEL
jgi:hypothetical protein